MPQHCTFVQAPVMWSPPCCVSSTASSPISLCSSKYAASCMVSDPPIYPYFLLALQYLLRFSFTLQSKETLACNRATSCIIAFAPSAIWSTALSINVGELFWWLQKWLFIRLICNQFLMGSAVSWERKVQLWLRPQLVLESATVYWAWKTLPLDCRGYKASSCKTSLYFLFCHRSKESITEGAKKLELVHMVDTYLHQSLNLAAICLFQWPKAADI